MTEILKTCTVCKLDLPATLEYFYADRRVKSNLRSKCKACQLKSNKETENPEVKRRYDRERYMGLRTISHDEALRRARESSKRYYATAGGAEKKRIWLREWRAKNPEKRRENERRYRIRYPEKFKAKVKRQTDRRRSTIEGRLNVRMSTRIRNFVKRGKDGMSWVELVGYTARDLKAHLERQFTLGMTWQKLISGKIHIDHIVPLREFRFSSIESDGFRAAWALSNLRPLWAKENLEKSSRRVFLL
jgi:hypothetical protein